MVCAMKTMPEINNKCLSQEPSAMVGLFLVHIVKKDDSLYSNATLSSSSSFHLFNVDVKTI